ncbi:hypothetical protein Q4561_07915 [Alteromonas sp. 1_MG-2023]|uniref:hypothetical protein n=1 Tax=Alteromonas sp. 1_MG-2023 TaxID=3062669 RepID=UPI0026E1AAB2|nr:hypothetical protein [Alteromonas sp. 1_MG-2023]MDO6566983.1 hypothetical protein [Alteromonas sp. 1_MG-2023]
MMTLLNKSLITALAFFSLVAAAQACDLHGGGSFGFGFNRLHPLAQQHYQASAFKSLSVKHAKQVDVTLDETATAKISYVIPLRYRDVNVSFVGSDGVEIVGDSAVLLEQDSGVYNLMFTVTRPGASHISIRINGINDGQPFSMNQKIELRSA